MIRVFVDTSVLFAAAYSSTSYARDLIRHALRAELHIIVTEFILEEAHRNLQKKAPAAIPYFELFIKHLSPEIIDSPSQAELQAVMVYVIEKDAPVIAAAIKSQPDYLATYDRKHLIDPPEVSAQSGLQIVTPDVVVQILRDRK